MTAAAPLARYSADEGALASGFADAELHHLWGHDFVGQLPNRPRAEFLTVPSSELNRASASRIVIFDQRLRSPSSSTTFFSVDAAWLIKRLLTGVDPVKPTTRTWRF
nr:hypothetical protein [Mesorhizobium mediterraneum]